MRIFTRALPVLLLSALLFAESAQAGSYVLRSIYSGNATVLFKPGAAEAATVFQRSIIDITKPSGGPAGAWHAGPNGTMCAGGYCGPTHKIQITVSSGQTGLQAARAVRSAVYADPAFAAAGYSVVMVDSGASFGEVRLIRSGVSYTLGPDSGSLGGIGLVDYGPFEVLATPALAGAGQILLAVGLLGLGAGLVRMGSGKV